MAEYLEYDWRMGMLSSEIHKSYQTNRAAPPDKNVAIQSVRNLIYQCKDLEVRNNIPQDDKTITKFLYARKFNAEDTFQLLQNYYWYRRKNPDIFKNFHLNASDIRKALENGLPGVLNSKDRKGRCVIILFANNWDCSYNLLSVYRSILYSLEFLSNDIHNQANGFVVIVDWTEFSFRQSTNLKPSVLRLMIEGLQDCFPARFKGIHFIGQPWYIETALTVIKPFLKDKTKQRIYVHGNNLSTLHDCVAKDILPAELGGEQPSYNPELWLAKLMEEEQKLSDNRGKTDENQ